MLGDFSARCSGSWHFPPATGHVSLLILGDSLPTVSSNVYFQILAVQIFTVLSASSSPFLFPSLSVTEGPKGPCPSLPLPIGSQVPQCNLPEGLIEENGQHLSHLDKSDGNHSPCARFALYFAAESLILKVWLWTSGVYLLLVKNEGGNRFPTISLSFTCRTTFKPRSTRDAKFLLHALILAQVASPKTSLKIFRTPPRSLHHQCSGQPRYIFSIARGIRQNYAPTRSFLPSHSPVR